MYIDPVLPTDIKGVIDTKLLILAEEVCIQSAKLSSSHTIQTINSMKELLRKTNSYYSNKIESEGTHPIDIEKAMNKNFSKDSKKRDLQKLSLAYIDTLVEIEEFSGDIYKKDFILDIHKKFYSKDGMDVFLNIDSQDKIITMKEGKLRDMDVEVNNYIAPPSKELNSIFNEFEFLYKHKQDSTLKAKKLLYAISAHHRVLYIHPFLDGNGRVARLYLDALLSYIDLEGYGLWNISRGLARDTQVYMEHLKIADGIKQGSHDGNGKLSSRALGYYTKYMLEVALEQIEFMNSCLKLDTLGKRIDGYIEMSNNNLLDAQPLPKYSNFLFKELLICGEMKRGEVGKVIGKSTRTAVTLVKKLEELNYIQSDTPNGLIRLKFNASFASKIIPNLIPDS